jgi:hypothetical protein
MSVIIHYVLLAWVFGTALAFPVGRFIAFGMGSNE